MLRWLPVLAVVLVPFLASCRATAAPRPALDPITGERLSVEEVADRLAGHDVVFLGELHESADGHRQQLALTKALADRRGSVVLSLEMFERDVQEDLDAYLRGDLGEAEFLGRARPWKGYGEFYRPVVEWARRTDRAVVAANVPRPLAQRVAREGLEAVAGETHVPDEVRAEPGEYRERFLAAMSGHGSIAGGADERWFQAQCIKDEAMAESIVEALERFAPARPLVVHWCGRFHSDFGLGTVERVLRRAPGVRCAVVTMVPEEDAAGGMSDEDRLRADFVYVVPRE